MKTRFSVAMLLGLAGLALLAPRPAEAQAAKRKAPVPLSRHALPPKEPIFTYESFAAPGSFAPADSPNKNAVFAAPGSYAPAATLAPASSFAPPDSFASRTVLALPGCFAPPESFALAGSFAQ